MNDVLVPVDINGHVGRTHNYCNAKFKINVAYKMIFNFQSVEHIVVKDFFQRVVKIPVCRAKS